MYRVCLQVRASQQPCTRSVQRFCTVLCNTITNARLAKLWCHLRPMRNAGRDASIAILAVCSSAHASMMTNSMSPCVCAFVASHNVCCINHGAGGRGQRALSASARSDFWTSNAWHCSNAFHTVTFARCLLRDLTSCAADHLSPLHARFFIFAPGQHFARARRPGGV